MGTSWTSVARPLQDFLKMDAEWVWTDFPEKAFQELSWLGGLAVELLVKEV